MTEEAWYPHRPARSQRLITHYSPTSDALLCLDFSVRSCKCRAASSIGTQSCPLLSAHF
ncbi:BQ5605_C007g04395 [Microbotryum silenes-dioicae]|uniref:BQ5605_C007g04395 protein n=1 Tax=Microbotryum silenes-dioicae TaxID=796604 RepID=A0A2X0MB19_9BASI|nr:BQ5605_C007g04395 [Microbotryum silenes-dioicae]